MKASTAGPAQQPVQYNWSMRTPSTYADMQMVHEPSMYWWCNAVIRRQGSQPNEAQVLITATEVQKAQYELALPTALAEKRLCSHCEAGAGVAPAPMLC